MMKHSLLIHSLRRTAILLAAIGLIGATHVGLAQRSSQQPVIVLAPTGLSGDSDFSGDLLTDNAFFNPVTADWRVNNSDGTVSKVIHGVAGDRPVVADYDGDHLVDIAVVHHEAGMLMWQIIQSSNGSEVFVQWGIEGDMPVKGDFDGDDIADIAVWRASDATWYVLKSSTNELLTIQFGISSDKPVPSDYDGDGVTDVAVFRQTEMTFYFLGSSDQVITEQPWAPGVSQRAETFASADYDGDGKCDFATFNLNAGKWSILESASGNYRTETFDVSASACNPGDIELCYVYDFAFPGDYDDDGKVDAAVWNSREATLTAVGSTNGLMTIPTATSSEMTPACPFFLTH